jgi:hypothetical protein
MLIFKSKKKNNKFFFTIFLGFFLLTCIISFDYSSFERMINCRCIGPGILGNVEQRLRIFLKSPVLLRTPELKKNFILDYIYKIYLSIDEKKIFLNNFQLLKINIKYDDLEKLKKDRKKALDLKKLYKPKKINAQIEFNNQFYDASVRLKGDLPDHWQNNHQWSLKINLKKDKTILGMNEFSIMIHSERNFPYNFLFSHIFNKNSLFYPKYETIRVNFNGSDWGLMLMEENFGKNYYFNYKIKEAPIFKMTNENDFYLSSVYSNISDNIDHLIRWQGKIETKIYNKNKILDKSNLPYDSTNKNLYSIFQNIQEILITEDKKYFSKIKKHFDLDQFAKSLAIASVFGDRHSLLSNNSRYYLDPYNLKIKPILTDKIYEKVNFKFFESISAPYKFLLLHQDFKKKYIKAVLKIEKDLKDYTNFSKEICTDYGPLCDHLFKFDDLKNNLNFIKINQNKIFQISDQKVPNEKISLSKINNNILENKLHYRFFRDGNLQLYNLTGEFLKIEKIILKKIKKKCLKKKCKYENNDFEISEIDINHIVEPSDYYNLKMTKVKTLEIDNSFNDIELVYFDEKNKKYISQSFVENPKFSKENFFGNREVYDTKFIKKYKNKYVISKGNYDVKKPIIVPEGFDLIIEDGTTLNMSSIAFIQVKNGILIANGKKDSKIILRSLKNNTTWKGIYVNSNDFPDRISTINFLKISNLNFFDNQKIQLTGSINFINSHIKISNTTITQSIAEDAINVVNSRLSVKNLNFENIVSDALDIDFGVGDIEKIYFNKVGGDAIDLSGSEIEIRSMIANEITDKAISVGEKSKLYIKNLNVKNSGIGIASKDSSIVNGKNIKIENCLFYDFAAYIKKNYFLGGKINLKNVSHCNSSLSQIQSEIIINDKIINNIKINSEELYN